MNAKDIQRYLSLVGKELQAMNVQEPIRLLLIGGGYMLTQVQNRTVTGDVDAVWVYPEVYADSEVYRLFRAAVELVADDEGLEPSWLNTDASDFVFAAGPLPKRKLWKKFGLVQVYLPPKDFILAHKLVSARKKDTADIQALCALLGIDTRKKAQKVVDKYISQDIQENHRVTMKLAILFE
jgi:hypothetical protein